MGGARTLGLSVTPVHDLESMAKSCDTPIVRDVAGHNRHTSTVSAVAAIIGSARPMGCPIRSRSP